MNTINVDNGIPEGFHWYNQPREYESGEGLIIHTDPNTDFWQRTHYGFRRDDGHCLLTEVEGDFTLQAHVKFDPRQQYDQCGIMARLDEENWIKASVEYEDETYSRLGSVVTNLGFSDWATTDISTAIRSMWYRMNKKDQDILLESSTDGQNWQQMRISHLHQQSEKLQIGVYACSPKDGSFTCQVLQLSLGENQW